MTDRTPAVIRAVSDRERRARLGVRHALSGSSRVRTPEEAARSVVCLHGTDPPSVHLSCWARCDSVSVADVEQALHGTRSIIRQQSMRETLFVFPRDLVPAVWGSAAPASPRPTGSGSSRISNVGGRHRTAKGTHGCAARREPSSIGWRTAYLAPRRTYARRCRRSEGSSTSLRARGGADVWPSRPRCWRS